ncbi:lysozyme inhibitor LprI family protein [Paraburkholderia strydomiana]|uniref:lysozyme inhibitor LprI family protein n=1 Tax=Paraburkholderia strydomiana TaxID=1245417 RepID=UPI0038BE1E0C
MLALACSSAFAHADDPADVISKQSGLPSSEVQGMLANCDANQTSMNFCAWRDRVVAEQRLQDAVAEKEKKFPGCKASLERKIAAWKKRRDASCKKSAEAENGGGSIVPMEIAACQAAETDRMTKVIRSRKCQ